MITRLNNERVFCSEPVTTGQWKKQVLAKMRNQKQLCREQKSLLREHIEIMQTDMEEPHPLQARLTALILQNSTQEVPLMMQMRSLAHCAVYITKHAARQVQAPYNEWDGHTENLMLLHDTLYELLITQAVTE